MNNLNFLLDSLILETAILEAVDWEEEELKKIQQKLSEYFSVCTKTDLDIIRVDLGHIFSDSIADVIYNYLKECISSLEKSYSKEKK